MAKNANPSITLLFPKKCVNLLSTLFGKQVNLKSLIRVLIIPIALAVVGIIGAISCNEEYQYTHGNVFGTITDATTGTPIENCNISVSNAEGIIEDRQTTDSDGKYKTKDLSDGTYTVSIEKEDYYTSASKSVLVKARETTKCDIALSRIPAKITTDTEELDFEANEALASLSFKIVNRYLDNLDWIAEYGCEWITSVSPDKGTLAHSKTETIIVKIDRVKLSGGENKTNIVVKSSNGQGGVNVSVKATGAEKEAPVLNVTGVSGVDKTTAVLTGEIVKPGIPTYTRRGFTCSLTSMDDNATELQAEVNDNTSFSYSVSGLTAGKKYYVRAFAINGSFGKVWSANEVSFTTIESYPQVRTDGVTGLNLTNGTCLLNGYIEQSGNPGYTERGFCVSETGEPTLDDNKYAVSGNGTGAYSSTMSGLVSERTYRVRAYAIQNNRVFYGSTVSFSTATTKTSIATIAASSVTSTSAVLNGRIVNDGNPKYTEKGFCYSLSSQSPSISDTRIIVSNPSTGNGDYSYSLTNLEKNKVIWFRAYAIQNNQPVYGDAISFETTWKETKVLTQSADGIGYYEMTLNGIINDAGTPSYSQKGFCYSALENTPTLNNATKIIVSGSAEGTYSHRVTGLDSHTTYHYRSYVIQDGNTVYGDVMSAKTYTPPSVYVGDAYAVPDAGMMNMSWTVELSGWYYEWDGPAVTEYGFVYGPGDNPNMDNPTGYSSVQGTYEWISGMKSFEATLTNVVGYSKYYFRGYVRTSLGYIYSELNAFSTEP